MVPPMLVITLVSQKGGSGKSTLACALAWELHARKKDVLLVDADPQGSCRMVGEVAEEEGHPAPPIVGMGKDLSTQLPVVAKGRDVVIIDTPGRHDDRIPRAALMRADVALLPVGQSAFDGWSMARTLDMVLEAQEVRPKLKAALVITRKQGRTVIGREARARLAEAKVPILRAETSFRVAWQEAAAAGLGVAQYAPNDKAAAEAKAVLDEVLRLAKGKGRGGAHE